jgi:hypothetical protein
MKFLWRFLLLSLTLTIPMTARADTQSQAKVTIQRAPNGGIQPQAVVDEKGAIHLIYFKGEPKAGDIFYVRSTNDGAAWSTPLRVNSQAGSAIAVGTVRGAQIALGKNGRVHVAWNGSDSAQPKAPTKENHNATPMLYARLNDAGDAFEPQRNLITWANGLDGGGTLAADGAGRVYVLWHAAPADQDDAQRQVFMARSTDEGQSFEREKAINPDATGACGCCQMRAFVDESGAFDVLYRAAGNNENRDAMLLVSRDGGATFQSKMLQGWRLNACPMSTFAFTQGAGETAPVFAAWETKKQIYRSSITSNAVPGISTPEAAPGSSDNRKHPALAVNKRGELLCVWTEGTGWARSGALAWQLYDANSQTTNEKGRAEGVPVWGLITAVALPDGNFVLIY